MGSASSAYSAGVAASAEATEPEPSLPAPNACFILGCENTKQGGKAKYCARHKRLADFMQRQAKTEGTTATWQKLQQNREALSAEMDTLIRTNPELGLGGFARGPPVNWLIIEQKLVARSYVKDEAVLTKVCWEEYKRKMQRKFGWEERRALQEWRKHENHPRVARDYHGPDGSLRLHLNLKDQVIAGREKAFEKGAVQQSQRLKNPKEAVLAAAQALASECQSQMGDGVMTDLACVSCMRAAH